MIRNAYTVCAALILACTSSSPAFVRHADQYSAADGSEIDLARARWNGRENADGYYFVSPQYFMGQFTTNIVVFDTYEEMQAKLTGLANNGAKVQGVKADANSFRDVAAFSVVNRSTKTCTLYLVNPKKHYVPQIIGHELLHCVYGNWHQEPLGDDVF